VLGPILLIWTTFSIYQQLISQTDIPAAYQQMLVILKRPLSILLFITAILLMPVNWMLETYKWYRLLQRETNISFFTCFKAVLAGLAFSMNTPNRSGDYIGRAIYLGKGSRWKATHYSVISGLGQLSITCIAGLLSLFLLRDHFTDKSIYVKPILWISMLASLLVLISCFYYKNVVLFVSSITYLKRFLPNPTMSFSLSAIMQTEILIISLLRFIIFTTQYFLIFNVFGVTFDYLTGFAIISIIFLIMADIPTITIADLGIRGKVALAVTGVFTSQALGVTAATVMVWLINLILPSMIGALFLWKIQLYKRV